MKNIINSEVETPSGKATLSEVYVTELGFIMAKMYYAEKKVWINYQIGELSKLLEQKNFKLTSEWTTRVVIS